jgi:TPR repeat protein
MNDYPTTFNGQFELESKLSQNIIVLDEEKAAYCIGKAVEHGHAAVLHALGNIYYFGRNGLQKNKKLGTDLKVKAIGQLIKEKDQGSADAMFQLARWGENFGYLEGEAAKQYARDAERGDTHAMFMLYVLYAGGTSCLQIKKDISYARDCLFKAAERGSLQAQIECGQLCNSDYGEIIGVPKDLIMASCWYIKASEQNRFEWAYGCSACSAEAQYYLGGIYRNGGDGFQKDMNKTISWYAKAGEACGRGHIQAILAASNLGDIYSTGDGVPIDREKAGYWYTKAAEHGRDYEKRAIGIKYYLGDGVPKDVEKGKRFIALAADMGDEDAQKVLKRISKGKSPV